MMIITKDYVLNKFLIKHCHVAHRNDGNDAMNNLVLFPIAICTDKQVKSYVNLYVVMLLDCGLIGAVMSLYVLDMDSLAVL